MTTPEIRTDHAAVTDAAAELRRVAAELPGVAEAVTDAVAAAAAQPLPAGTAEGPEVAVLHAAMKQLTAAVSGSSDDAKSIAAELEQWAAELAEIQEDAADEVAAVGGGAAT